VDPATHDIVAAEVLLENVHDAEVLPTLLNPLRRVIATVYADETYDTNACSTVHSQRCNRLSSATPECRDMGKGASP
jgi:hypothetical protein